MLILTAKRILVIDDAEDIREVAQVSLEMVGGWEVLTASSGREGVAKALAEQPDAILLDVMMPDQDGPTTFLQLQANNATQHIPVILLTAKALAGDRRMFADLGVVSVIAKPFEPMFLAAQVAEALGWEHEYEASLFSAPKCFEYLNAGRTKEIEALRAIASQYETPELINDGPQTAPSKHIIAQFPDYGKAKSAFGPQLAERIGLQVIRSKCSHFDKWLARLESLNGELII